MTQQQDTGRKQNIQTAGQVVVFAYLVKLIFYFVLLTTKEILAGN